MHCKNLNWFELSYAKPSGWWLWPTTKTGGCLDDDNGYELPLKESRGIYRHQCGGPWENKNISVCESNWAFSNWERRRAFTYFRPSSRYRRFHEIEFQCSHSILGEFADTRHSVKHRATSHFRGKPERERTVPEYTVVYWRILTRELNI